MKKISIISVNFNQPEVTEQFLSSVIKYSNPNQVEIIVVDNGSKVDHTERWKKTWPEVEFIRSEKNLGFAGGNNLGIQNSQGEYLFFANNDTEFTPQLLDKLAEILDTKPLVGIVSPKILYFDEPNKIQYAGFTEMNFSTGRNKCIGQYEVDNGQYDDYTGPTAFAHGAAMMARKNVLEKAGVMPENFFLYYEEMDWCEKIKRAGYQVWIEPKAVIYHKESVSVGKQSALKEYFMNRNRILFIRRNADMLSCSLFYIHFIFLVVPRNIISYFINRRMDLAPQLFKAFWWNITHDKNSYDLGYDIQKI